MVRLSLTASLLSFVTGLKNTIYTCIEFHFYYQSFSIFLAFDDEYKEPLDLSASEEGFYRSRLQIQPRRMKQLQAQLVGRHGMRNFTKIYGYGCYCLNLGERECF